MSVLSVSEMEVEMPGEDTAASVSGTETEDYPGTADEDEEPKNEQLSSRVRLPGGTISLLPLTSWFLSEARFSFITINVHLYSCIYTLCLKKRAQL